MSGMSTSKKILKSLPDEFTLFQLRMAIKSEAGFEERTIMKYIKNLLELDLIEETEMIGRFKKVK